MTDARDRQLFQAAKAFDLDRVQELVRQGARHDGAFLSDQGSTLSVDDPNSKVILQRLRDQGRDVRTENEALFELYETLLRAGHLPPDGSSRRCVVRIVYGADPSRFERALVLAELCEADVMLTWETSAWAHHIRMEREAEGKTTPTFLEPLSVPHALFMDAMADAAEQGHLVLLNRLVSQLPKDPHRLDGFLRGGSSPFFKAVAKGHIPCAQVLLTLLTEQQWRTRGFHSSSGVSAVSIAASHGQREMLDWLIDQGFGQDEAYPGTVITQAIQAKKFQTALNLVDRGWDVNAVQPGEPTPLHMAVWEKRPELIEPLLKAGHAVDPLDGGEFTPLVKAGMVGMAEAIAPLVKAGANLEAVDTQGKTAMHWACGNDRVETVEELRRAGARMDAVDLEGNTPLSWAKGKVRAMLQQENLEQAIPVPVNRAAPRF